MNCAFMLHSLRTRNLIPGYKGVVSWEFPLLPESLGIRADLWESQDERIMEGVVLKNTRYISRSGCLGYFWFFNVFYFVSVTYFHYPPIVFRDQHTTSPQTHSIQDTVRLNKKNEGLKSYVSLS